MGWEWKDFNRIISQTYQKLSSIQDTEEFANIYDQFITTHKQKIMQCLNISDNEKWTIYDQVKEYLERSYTKIQDILKTEDIADNLIQFYDKKNPLFLILKMPIQHYVAKKLQEKTSTITTPLQ
jgi:hypothetical protein